MDLTRSQKGLIVKNVSCHKVVCAVHFFPKRNFWMMINDDDLTRDTQIGTQAGSRLPRREPREGAVSRRPGCCNNLTLEKFRVDQKKFLMSNKKFHED